MARAAFDPHYAHEEDLDAGDLGMDDSDVHYPTDDIIERRLREVCGMVGCLAACCVRGALQMAGWAVLRRRWWHGCQWSWTAQQ
jgi:hypothetical protein